MIEKPITFFSEGNRLTGTIYYPDTTTDDPGSARGLVINSGYQGFNVFYPKLFASVLTGFGYVCLGFDYRGMAESEGEKGRVLLEEQAQDIRNAVTFLAAQPEVDPSLVGLIGWGMGAANVILAADRGRNVAAVAALNGFYRGRRWLQAIHTYDRYCAILAEVEQDRVQRVADGRSREAETFAHYPLDPATDQVVQGELVTIPGFGHPTQVQFTESVLDLDADRVVAGISPVPLFIGHGRDNTLHPYSEATSLYEAAAAPKTLHTIDGRHNDFMFADDPRFTALCETLHGFFDQAFTAAANPPRSISEPGR